MNKDTYAILLAGGRGTRLWPLSGKGYAKPFMRFESKKTLIEESIIKIKGLIDRKHIIIVADNAQKDIARKAIKGVPKKNVILEPFGRNTASAAGLAAINLKPESIMVVLSADQLVEGQAQARRALAEGIKFVRENKDVLVTVSTPPDSPSVSFGYVKVGDRKKGNIFAIDRFIEKPPLEKAKVFVKGKNYFWNAGIFIFKAGTILGAMKKYAPNLYRNLELVKKRKISVSQGYSRIKDISIDYEIMEKADNLYTVIGAFGWKDIGNWVSVGGLFKKDPSGNASNAEADLINVSDSFIYTTLKNKIGVVGLSNVIIVQTDNGLLVCSKKDAEKVRKLARPTER